MSNFYKGCITAGVFCKVRVVRRHWCKIPEHCQPTNLLRISKKLYARALDDSNRKPIVSRSPKLDKNIMRRSRSVFYKKLIPKNPRNLLSVGGGADLNTYMSATESWLLSKFTDHTPNGTIVQLIYSSKPNNSFFLALRDITRVIHPTSKDNKQLVWSCGQYNVRSRAYRKDGINLISWWNSVLNDHLPRYFKRFSNPKTNFFFVIFKQVNNLALRYAFFSSIFLSTVQGVTMFYVIKHNFYTKTFIYKKARYIKKYKRRSIIRADMFSRREFWIS